MYKKYFIISNIVLITIAVYLCVSGFYAVVKTKLGRYHPEKIIKTTSPVPEVATRIPASIVASITGRNLFKTSKDTVKAEEAVDPGKLEETELKLKLWGTVSGNGKDSYAVIEDTKVRKQNLYRQGDPIQHATVKLIQREVVILAINGKDEKLSMEEKRSKSRPGSNRRAPFSINRNKSGGSQGISVQRSMIDKSLQDINKLMKQVKIRPHFKDGKPDGLILSSIKPRSLFRKMGLRNGDIISGIDGKKIESVDDALGFYESLRAATNISLQIKRRGKEKTIDYTIE